MKKTLSTILTTIGLGAFLPGQAFAILDSDYKSNASTHKAAIMKDKVAEEKSWIDNLSGSFALTTNYLFRGVSQTTNLPAAQGGLTYSFPYGFYFNVWGSNVRYIGYNASVEMDAALGIAGILFDQLSYDINFARYFYLKSPILNYNELNTLFNWKFLQFGFSYSANVYGVHQTGRYFSGGINYDIPPEYAFNVNNLNITALYGVYSLPKAAGNSYNDYIVALTKKIKHYSFTVQWTDTNGGQNNPPFDDSIFAFTIAAEF